MLELALADADADDPDALALALAVLAPLVTKLLTVDPSAERDDTDACDLSEDDTDEEMAPMTGVVAAASSDLGWSALPQLACCWACAGARSTLSGQEL